MLHREQKVLWQVKRLFTEMRGDLQWAPVGLFHTPFDDRLLALHRASTSSAAVSAEVLPFQRFQEPFTTDASTEVVSQARQEDVQMADDIVAPIESTLNGTGAVESAQEPRDVDIPLATNGILHNGTSEAHDTNGTLPTEDAAMEEAGLAQTIEESAEKAETGTSVGDADSTTTPAHRMTTRAQANQSTQTPSLARSISPGSFVPVIHPFFQFPPDVVKDPNVGLPAQMADEARLALTTYISKQEEIVRSCREMHSGLLKAMKMRTNVWNWTKAEGHLDLSDNEDYIDLQEWGIDARDTRIKWTKGQQEDEQETEEQERVKRNPRRVGRAAKE